MVTDSLAYDASPPLTTPWCATLATCAELARDTGSSGYASSPNQRTMDVVTSGCSTHSSLASEPCPHANATHAASSAACSIRGIAIEPWHAPARVTPACAEVCHDRGRDLAAAWPWTTTDAVHIMDPLASQIVFKQGDDDAVRTRTVCMHESDVARSAGAMQGMRSGCNSLDRTCHSDELNIVCGIQVDDDDGVPVRRRLRATVRVYCCTNDQSDDLEVPSHKACECWVGASSDRNPSTLEKMDHEAHGVGMLIKALVQQNAGASLVIRVIMYVAALLCCVHSMFAKGPS